MADIETISWEELKQELHAGMTVEEEAEYQKAYEEAGIRMDLSELVYNARVKAKLTQTELAKRAATTQAVVSAIENGAKMPNLAMLSRIADALDLPLKVSIGDTGFTYQNAA